MKQALSEKGLGESEHVGHETKLLANRALCSLANSNYSNLDDFKRELDTICSRVKLELGKLESLEDAPHSSLFFNYAILLYYNKQYTDCFRIVEKIYYHFSELLDERLFYDVNFLLVELLIQLRQVNN